MTLERLAIILAEGRNGGTWPTHYTQKQKQLWLARAIKVVELISEQTFEERRDEFRSRSSR